MSDIILGSHVGMSGKEMFLASVKEAESYGANALMIYTGAPQNTKRKEISQLNIDAGLSYAEKIGIKDVVIHAPYRVVPERTRCTEPRGLQGTKGLACFDKRV